MARLILLDNDALLKLCSYDLFDQALNTLSASPDDVYVLPTAKYSLLPAKSRLKRCKDALTADRLEQVLKHVKVLSQEVTNLETLDALLNFPGLDSGEALLITHATEMNDALIITGDKRAVAALASVDELENIASQLEGKVCTLELLIKQVSIDNFTSTQQKIRNKPDTDKSLTNIFGTTTAASNESVLEGLNSYINHIKKATGGLLAEV